MTSDSRIKHRGILGDVPTKLGRVHVKFDFLDYFVKYRGKETGKSICKLCLPLLYLASVFFDTYRFFCWWFCRLYQLYHVVTRTVHPRWTVVTIKFVVMASVCIAQTARKISARTTIIVYLMKHVAMEFVLKTRVTPSVMVQLPV